MADKWQAQYNFWAGFGIPAYEQNSVPDVDDREYPYITYEAASSGFDEDVPVNASIWTRSDSWEQADGFADAIYDALADGGVIVPYTDTRFTRGAIHITAGEPFAESMGDPDDSAIKRKLLNVTLHY